MPRLPSQIQRIYIIKNEKHLCNSAAEQFSSRLEFLQDEKDAASTTSAKNKIQKEIDKLKKKQTELSKFDDELRHYADMKISLDLDDGVKVNYGKFGKLLG